MKQWQPKKPRQQQEKQGRWQSNNNNTQEFLNNDNNNAANDDDHGDKVPSQKRIPIYKILAFCNVLVKILTAKSYTNPIYVTMDSVLVWDKLHITWHTHITKYIIQ